MSDTATSEEKKEYDKFKKNKQKNLLIFGLVGLAVIGGLIYFGKIVQ